MVHLYSYHTRIEDIQRSYSVQGLKGHMEYITQDRAALDTLQLAVRKRLLDLEKVEFVRFVEIKRGHDYKGRIEFYVARNLSAVVAGKEIHVESSDNKRFVWKERKEAMQYAWDLGVQNGLQIRDLTVKKKAEGS